MRFSYLSRSCKGEVINSIIMYLMIVAFVIFPVMSAVIEKYILGIKVQEIKDSMDLSNISTYYALTMGSTSSGNIELDSPKALVILKKYTAINLNLNSDLTPGGSGCIADGQVTVKSVNIYTNDFPKTCPNGRTIKRITVHSLVTVPLKPELYAASILKALGRSTIDIDVHEDTEIPLDN